jgi:hypothetical protein
MRINTTTRLGKRSKNPRGIDIEEFPFNLMRLRKNDNLGEARAFSFFQSSVVGTCGTVGTRFHIR